MIVKRIKFLREDKDWTQKQVAEMLHISRSAYSAYENGINAIPVEVIVKLSRLFGTSTDFLLGETDEVTPYERSENREDMDCEESV